MTLKLEYIQLKGGLDESSGPTVPRAGRLLGCENFELVFGEPGYRRIDGYERLDGRAAPSTADYYTLSFTAGTAAIAVGDTITGPGATAHVLRVAVSTGSWVAGTAAGTLILTDTTGAFAATEAISVGTPKATASGAWVPSSVADTAYTTDIVLARDYYRNLIAKPVGEGAVLGVAIYNDVAYCLRNDVGSATATLWKSSSSGWTAVRTGLRPGGSLRTINASFSGAAGSLALFGVDGKNRPWQIIGSTFAFLPAVYASEITSTTNVTPATGSKTFNFTETSRSWSSGQEVIVYSASNAANYMIGTVTSSTGTSVTVNVTSFGGAASTDWHLCRNDGVDRAFIVTAHKNHLFLGYPLGQLQHSDLGSPLTFGATAGSIAFGDELVDLQTLRSDVLAVMQQNRINLVYGSDKTTWENKQHSATSNTKARSTVEVGGNAIYLADAGLMTLTGSLNFGDFDAANLAQDAIGTLRSVMSGYKCTSLIKKDSQYRVYGANNTCLVMNWLGGVVTQESVSFTKLRYDHQPVCTATSTINGDEYVIFGTDDGWVMRERVGTTFDGVAITAFFRTSHWHCGNPQLKKRFRKITLDADSDDAVIIYFKQDFDFSGMDYQPSITFTAQPSGGFYDAAYWNEFFWSNPETAQQEVNVDGVGRHMSLTFWSQGDNQSYHIYGMGLQYSPLEIKR